MEERESFSRSQDACRRAAQFVAAYTRHLEKRGATSCNVAVVFDIDDTLIRDMKDGVWREEPSVVKLYHMLKAMGCKIHLVTAREDGPSVRKWTRD